MAAAATGYRRSRRPVKVGTLDAVADLRDARTRKEQEIQECRRQTCLREGATHFLAEIGLGKHPSTLNRQLSVKVLGHEEAYGHTYYHVRCALQGSEGCECDTTWIAKKRLCEIREEIFDMVQEAFGTKYDIVFAETPFALRGGLPGTTARLLKWFETLATCVNTGMLSPDLCAHTMASLKVPVPETCGSDAGRESVMSNATRAQDSRVQCDDLDEGVNSCDNGSAIEVIDSAGVEVEPVQTFDAAGLKTEPSQSFDTTSTGSGVSQTYDSAGFEAEMPQIFASADCVFVL